MRRFAKRMGIDDTILTLMHKALSCSKMMEIIPLTGTGHRGFLLIIDRKLSFWFYQNGDHFTYDGYEMGKL